MDQPFRQFWWGLFFFCTELKGVQVCIKDCFPPAGFKSNKSSLTRCVLFHLVLTHHSFSTTVWPSTHHHLCSSLANLTMHNVTNGAYSRNCWVKLKPTIYYIIFLIARCPQTAAAYLGSSGPDEFTWQTSWLRTWYFFLNFFIFIKKKHKIYFAYWKLHFKSSGQVKTDAHEQKEAQRRPDSYV